VLPGLVVCRSDNLGSAVIPANAGTQQRSFETANGREFTRIRQSKFVHASVGPAPAERQLLATGERGDVSPPNAILLLWQKDVGQNYGERLDVNPR